ncbi:potassium voltage-gated channel protein Shaw-like [Saccostrea echinata]|uniref:potassium voltage-gated channel protein Shaw-like n=1 Tax=Saccostrea echinata TaxID=191078 RepID=UPI002A7F8CD3|nr:potassium voltage-gated channel protein Shaw-like [Saccostrea echinata]
MDAKEATTLNITGLKYKLSKDAAKKLPNLKVTSDVTEYSFERPRQSFEAVYNYCLVGKLHIPPTVCIGEFLEELEFWGIDVKDLEKCCHHRYVLFMREQENLRGFLRCTEAEIVHYEEVEKNVTNNLKNRMWRIIDNQNNDIKTKAYFVLSTAVILLAIFGVAFSTVSITNQGGSTDSHFSTKSSTEYTTAVYNSTDGAWINESLRNDSQTYTGGGKIFSNAARDKVLTTKNSSPETRWFLYIEHFTNAFFTVELILRLVCCPSLRRYFQGYLNWLDIIVLVASYGRYIVLVADMTDSSTDADPLLYLQMFRVLRLLRIIENVPAFKILCYSVRIGRKDLMTMILFLFMGMLLFSNFLYFVESNEEFNSIPDAWWFSIVTMTTVGFGDMVPRTSVGRVIGALCALSGVLFISLTIPIFVNTFQSLYLYASFNSKRLQKQ